MLLALRSLSSEHSLPCPSLLVLPILSRSPSLPFAVPAVHMVTETLLRLLFAQMLILSRSTANTVSPVSRAVFRS